jgi:hypothetical protein
MADAGHAKPTKRPALLENRGVEWLTAVLALLALAGAVVLLLAGVVRNWAPWRSPRRRWAWSSGAW